MTAKQIALRYDGKCATCGAETPARTIAIWDSATRHVTCLRCAAPATTDETPLFGEPAISSPGSPWAPPAPIEVGVGGASAAKEYERRRAKQDREIEKKWGTDRLGKIAKRLADEPPSTTAWAKGATGERKLAERLANDLQGAAFVLNDRSVPGTRWNIDHVVVAASGVWVVDAKTYAGRVERRDVGGWFRTDHRLFVKNRDHTKLTDGMAWQVGKVRQVLEPIGFSGVAIHPVLCFTNSEWPVFAKPFCVRGVTVTWPTKLIESVAVPGPLDEQTIRLLAHQLSTTLPAASAA